MTDSLRVSVAYHHGMDEFGVTLGREDSGLPDTKWEGMDPLKRVSYLRFLGQIMVTDFARDEGHISAELAHERKIIYREKMLKCLP